jgi:hypothetical protein
MSFGLVPAMSYYPAGPLTAVNQEPPCAESGYITKETINSSYSWTSAVTVNSSFTRYFNVSTAAPMIRKQEKLAPA